jgi:hypothetical protein
MLEKLKKEDSEILSFHAKLLGMTFEEWVLRILTERADSIRRWSSKETLKEQVQGK